MATATDAPRAIALEITDDDIRDGDPGSDWFCPVTRALRRALGATDVPFTDAWIWGPCEAVVRQDGRWLFYATPPALDAWMLAFDTNEEVAPATFELCLDHVQITRPSEGDGA